MSRARVVLTADGEGRSAKPRKRRPASERRIIGVDGEGHDTPDGRHIYVYLAAVDEEGTLVAEAYDPEGLSHEACARMLLSLPRDALNFGFMFSYDVTKIIEALPELDRYYLVRPRHRDEWTCASCKATFSDVGLCPECGESEVRSSSRPVLFQGRKYDYFNGSLQIQHKSRKTKVWDCFRFFGCSFVAAVEDWLFDKDGGEIVLDGAPLATKVQVARIAEMKQKRGALEQEDPEDVKNYCREECHLLAKMMRRVVDAHEEAGIPLERFDGAGSTATSLLKAHAVAEYKGPSHKDLDVGLARAIACAFFGGRFEDSMVGVVRRRVFGFDISSAYPYALTFMPCLRCGSWRKTDSITYEDLERSPVTVARFYEDLERSPVTVARFCVRAVSARERAKIAWCPLPCRDAKGSIAYATNFTGWAWGPELAAALRGWPDLVELTGEAYVYETPCDHRPFSFLPGVYRQRILWGKEGRGKALKLGSNASYGKTAQSIGEDPPFQSWVWAGMTTATTRGQILDAIRLARDPWSVLTIATDGIYASEDLPLGALVDPDDPKSWKGYATLRDTGTSDLAKPLGGWERKIIDEGVFVAKPGLYYRLDGVEEARLSREIDALRADGRDAEALRREGELMKRIDVRARGVGRREVFRARLELVERFLAWDREDMSYAVPVESRRFFGAKHSIYVRSRCQECGTSWPSVPEEGCPKKECSRYGLVGTGPTVHHVEDAEGRPVYGTWGVRQVRIGFDPHPKRERALTKGGSSARLRVRDLGGVDSAPYDVGGATTTPEGEAARLNREFNLEQPDYEEAI